VRARSCCGDCGAATRNDIIAINRRNLGSYTTSVCQNTSCTLCYTQQDPTLLASCLNGACSVVDLLALPLTDCRTDQDCRLRTRECCECGGTTAIQSLIALRKDSEAEYRRLACDPSTACDACVPSYPEFATAKCFGGRCTVTGMPGTTPPPP